MEAHHGNYDVAKSIFVRGITRNPHYIPLINAYALFEAQLGNIEVLPHFSERPVTLTYYLQTIGSVRST
jgi:hypothetical protein